MKPQIFTFGLILFGIFTAIVFGWQWLTSISYDKPRKSPITNKHKQIFKPLL